MTELIGSARDALEQAKYLNEEWRYLRPQNPSSLKPEQLVYISQEFLGIAHLEVRLVQHFLSEWRKR